MRLAPCRPPLPFAARTTSTSLAAFCTRTSSRRQQQQQQARPRSLQPLLPPQPMSQQWPGITNNQQASRLLTSRPNSSFFSSMAPSGTSATAAAPWGFMPDLPSWAAGIAIPLAAVALTAGLVTLAAWLDAKFKSRVPDVLMQPTSFNQAVLSRCPTLRELYRPTPFLTNGHVETILASQLRPKPHVPYRREFLRASDGGIVTLDWPHQEDPTKDLPEDAPVLILLPGLTGGSGCSYVLHAVRRAARHGIRAVVFNSRGTADSPVTTPQFYSASFTGDMRLVVQHVRQQRPNSHLLAAGWSLGANIMMRYLGEEGEATPLVAAVSMCNPFNLTISNRNWEQGFNKIYDANLAKALIRIYEKHDKVFRGAKGTARGDLAAAARTVREFDDYITIQTFGWPTTDEYYAKSSSCLSVPQIRIPLLCVQALDDPIAPKEAIPYEALQANPNCVLVCTPTGGHLGWVAEPGGLQGEPWTDQVMAEWLDSVLLELRNKDKEQQRSNNGNGDANKAAGTVVRTQEPALAGGAGKATR